MAENESRLFRKSSLERVSSPEQLNEYIKVTNPSLIVILIGIFTILAAGVIWIFTSNIPDTVDLAGVVITDRTDVHGAQNVYCFVPIATSKRLTKDMEVQISPEYADRSEYGYINGKITYVGTDIITNEYLRANFENPQMVVPVIQDGQNLVEVEMSMGKWSNDKGEGMDITDGTICKASAIVGGTKTLDLVFKI